MSVEGLDLYDDLDDFQQAEEAKSKELQSWEAKCTASQVEIVNLYAQNKALEKKIKTMEVNFQNLLDTAKAEIKRKDTLITQLRKEKDDLCFRRKRGTKFEQSESNPLNGTEHQEHKRFKKDEDDVVKVESISAINHKSDKRREENRQDKHKSPRNDNLGHKHEANYDKSNNNKRDKQQSSDATKSRHRSKDGRRTNDRDRDRNRRRSRSRDRDRYRSRERNRERCNSRKPHKNSKDMQKRRRSRSRSRSNQKGSKNFSNRNNSHEREGKSDAKEKHIKQETLEALFGNTPKPNTAAQQIHSSNSSVESAKVLKKLQANAEPITPQEMYTPENLAKVGPSLVNDIETESREDVNVTEFANYFVSNVVEQLVEVSETNIQVATIDIKTAEYIPGLDLIANEQSNVLQYNPVAIDNVDLKLNKSVGDEPTETKKQTNEQSDLEMEIEVLANTEKTESKTFVKENELIEMETEVLGNTEKTESKIVVEANKFTENEQQSIKATNNVVEKIIQDFSDIENTIVGKVLTNTELRTVVNEIKLKENAPKSQQAINETNNDVEQIIQDISEIERKYAIEKYVVASASKFSIAQSSEAISNCLKFDVNSDNIVVEDKQHMDDENSIANRKDIEIIEDIRLPVMMDIEDIVLQVDVEDHVQDNRDAADIKDTEHSVQTLINVQLGKDVETHVKEQLTHEITFTGVPGLVAQIENPFEQAITSDIISQVDTNTSLISKQTVMYAQPDSTKFDHNDSDLAHKAVANQLKPVVVVLKDIKSSYQNVSLEKDAIDFELEQLHQHAHSDVQPDETVVTSTSMKIGQTPKNDLISILTQSPLHQTPVKVSSPTPPKLKIRGKNRTGSEKTTPISYSSSDTTPERCEKTPLKKRKIDLTDNHKHFEEVPQTPPSAGTTTITSPLDVTINETFNSSSQELNQSFGSNSSIVTKRCSLGNSDYQYERVNDEVVLRVTRRGRRRRPAATIEKTDT